MPLICLEPWHVIPDIRFCEPACQHSMCLIQISVSVCKHFITSPTMYARGEIPCPSGRVCGCKNFGPRDVEMERFSLLRQKGPVHCASTTSPKQKFETSSREDRENSSFLALCCKAILAGGSPRDNLGPGQSSDEWNYGDCLSMIIRTRDSHGHHSELQTSNLNPES